MASLTFKPWDPSRLRKASSKPAPSASARKQQMPHDIAAPRSNGDDKDKPRPAGTFTKYCTAGPSAYQSLVQQTFDFAEQTLGLGDMNDAEDGTMVYPLLDHLAGSLGAQDDEPLHMRDGALVVAQSTGHWQFTPEIEHELQPQGGTPSAAQLRLPTSSLREEDMVQSCVPLWPDERPIQVMGDNGANEPCDPTTGCREGVEQSAGERVSDSGVITEPTSTIADTPPFPTGDASGPLPVAGLASVPTQGSPTVTDTPHFFSPHLSSPHFSSPCTEVSDTDTNNRFCGVPDGERRHNPSRQGMSNTIRGDEGRPDDESSFGRSDTDCQGEGRSKPARLAEPPSVLSDAQEMAASRRYRRPTRTTPPLGAGRSTSLDSEPRGKPGSRRAAAPPQSMQDNDRGKSLDRLRPRGCKRIRSVEGHLQARQLSDIDRDSSLERAAKRRRSAAESQTTTVRRSSRLCRGPTQHPREGLAASSPQTAMLGIRFQSGAPTGPKGVEVAASSSPVKECTGQANRCYACGLSPPLLLGVAKKALAFGGLGGLLEGPETELLPSQLAILVMRSCLSLIENHVSEGRWSAVNPRTLSNHVEPESFNQSDVVPDDESAEDRDSDGTITEDSLSSDEAGSDDETGSDDGQRGQRRRWLPLDERRLTAYMKENLSIASISTKLNRSESAVMQHWRIMSPLQADRVSSPTGGGRRRRRRRLHSL